MTEKCPCVNCDVLERAYGWRHPLGCSTCEGFDGWVSAKPNDVAGICADAEAAIYGDRQDSYGPPYDEFNFIAEGWQAILSKRNGQRVTVTAEDVAMMMVFLKVMRETHKHERDNLVDICGYAESAQRIINHRNQENAL